MQISVCHKKNPCTIKIPLAQKSKSEINHVNTMLLLQLRKTPENYGSNCWSRTKAEALWDQGNTETSLSQFLFQWARREKEECLPAYFLVFRCKNGAFPLGICTPLSKMEALVCKSGVGKSSSYFFQLFRQVNSVSHWAGWDINMGAPACAEQVSTLIFSCKNESEKYL